MMNLRNFYSSHKVFTEHLLDSRRSDELLVFSNRTLLPKEQLEAKLEAACDFTCIENCLFSTRELFYGKETILLLDRDSGYMNLYR